MYKCDQTSGIKGTVAEPDVLYQNGKVVSISIRYEDIDGGAYASDLRIRSGRLERISFSDELRDKSISR
jgi:hypothetical protein